MSSRGAGLGWAGLAGVVFVGAGVVFVGFGVDVGVGVGLAAAGGVLTGAVAAVVGTLVGVSAGRAVEVLGVAGLGAVVGRVPADTDNPSWSPGCPQALNPNTNVAAAPAAATFVILERMLPDMSFPSVVSTCP
ncbi:hypothetical protein JNB_15243 [Janibacter sp. HTCC2649]|nr:hypothetical protein JNB_15243 [Janibacter sp. HTCC2649]